MKGFACWTSSWARMSLWYMHLEHRSNRMNPVVAGSLFALEVLHRSGMQFYEVSHTCMLPSWGLPNTAVAAAVRVTWVPSRFAVRVAFPPLLRSTCGQHCLPVRKHHTKCKQVYFCADSNLCRGHWGTVSGNIPCPVWSSLWCYLAVFRRSSPLPCRLPTCVARRAPKPCTAYLLLQAWVL